MIRIDTIGVRDDMDGHDWNRSFHGWQSRVRFYKILEQRHRDTIKRKVGKLEAKLRGRLR